jgi:CDP-2,3-bis-(O-geranylgeranyl)-sn-glycerol synthase
MLHLPQGLIALLLVLTANAAPWLLDRLIGKRGTAPIDHGLRLPDHRRVFGAHKTWRGFAAGIVATAIVAFACGIGLLTGALFGALALIGDALTSFVKRRLGLTPGSEVPGLDQLPEALLPLTVLAAHLELTLLEVAVVAFTFMVVDIVSMRVRHRD